MKPPPVNELVNVLEMAEVAQMKLAPELFAEIAGIASDRQAFDRITFRPRLMQDVTGLDLSVELFGQKHFAPILIGPITGLQRFHPEGEAALRRGADAAKAVAVLSGSGDWVYVEPGAVAPAQAKVVVLSAGGWDWPAIDRFRKSVKASVVLKGILSVDEARTAAERGIGGIIVSNYRVAEGAHALDLLPGIADAVAGRIPILADGGFRRGTDIAKALALGARAVLIGRPAV